jgi:hypothetical protein
VWLARLLIPLSYLALTVLVFANVWRAPTTRYVGSIADALQTIWFISWTAHALAHHQSLLFTHALNAPYGINLLWNTPVLLPGVVVSPMTLSLGPVLAYNVLMTVAFTSSAWAGYAAINHFVQNRLASWIGGLLFGFSPYMMAQSLGHLDLNIMFYPPIVMILFDEIVIRQRMRWWTAGMGLGLLTAVQLFVLEEIVAGVAIGIAVATCAACLQWRSRIATHWEYVVRAGALAAAVTLLCGGWALAYQFTAPEAPPGLSEVTSNGVGGDLLAFVVPTSNQLLSPSFAQQLAAHFVAQTTGQDGYLGLPLLVALGVLLWTLWDRPLVRLLAVTGGVLSILSLGPALNVLGRVLPVPLPWALFQHVPIIDNLVPLRLVGYASLCIGALVAYGLAQLRLVGRVRALAMGTLTILTLITWLPSVPRPDLALPNPPALPQAVAERIPPGAVVLFAPYSSPSTADAMYYQAGDSFRFDLVDGYAYGRRPDLPLRSVLGSGTQASISVATRQIATPGARAAVVQRYRALHIDRVVVPPGTTAAAYTALFTELFQAPPLVVDGFSVWSLTPGQELR